MSKKVTPAPAPAYDWTLTDDLFAQAKAWNVANPTQAPKTIQLVVTPGINSPSWVVNALTSCDYMFKPPSGSPPPKSCGAVTFLGFVEGGTPTVGGTKETVTQVLPMPWNSSYKNSWQAFLTVLASRYLSNPLFVSIAVAGPTASSEEMMFPNDNDASNPQTQFGTPISPNDMWLALLKSHYSAVPAPQYPGLTYQNSDQGFIDEWEKAIDMYGKIFSGITVSISTGNSFPLLSKPPKGSPFPVPGTLAAGCPNANMDCPAETAIIAYFEEPGKGGNNAKAVQEDGLKGLALTSTGNLGVAGIKLVSQNTQFDPAPSEQILGGAQFGKSFSHKDSTDDEGCPSTTPCSISPEQAVYNVLSAYFSGTPVATSFGGMMGAAPLNYLQIYAPDFQYAEKKISASVMEGASPVTTTAQDLLNLASQKLLEIAEPTLP
jgi:hypothetical protein